MTFVSYNALAARNTRVVRAALFLRGFTIDNCYVKSSSWTGDTFIFYSEPEQRVVIDEVLDEEGFVDRWYLQAPQFGIIMCFRMLYAERDT